ncbi:calcium-binding protein [Mesorhizobium sp. L-8-3]|uniref:calcium-binding protein n=1 Tax=Mesorhizobium sp. L-8-3 TaxID=2744522 RepID=UPI001935E725|nr:calcium-binding protein [Mesorhizobium sp. L-8-3]BCH25727.1 hypothetical protein MesoLjLb_55120 [Mesorhizobium sp. L-8-3]
MAIIDGDSGNNPLNGTNSGDTIDGKAGNDIINGFGGNDTLIGGDGSDIFAYTTREFDNDTITDFQRGVDRIDLSALNIADFETLKRFISSDSLGNAVITFAFYGSTESITLRGINQAWLTGGNFIFNSSTAARTVEGTNYRDVLFGGNGNDTLNGYSGNDTLSGGAGNDQLHGQEGDDTLIGGAGNDVYLYAARDFDRDTIEGFSLTANTDKIDLTALNVADFTTLKRFISSDSLGNAVISLGFYGNAESITLKGVAASQLSAANFIFNSSSTALSVEGTSYRDVLFGGNGNDALTGYSGNDVLSGGGGNDQLLGMDGDDTLIGGAGNDVYLYTARDFDRDTIEGFSTASDKIDLSALWVADFTTLSRFITNDASGNAVITLGFYGNTESITLKGVLKAQLSAANFIFNANPSGVTVEGTGYRDVLFGGNGNDALTGYSGNDTMSAGGGNDRLLGMEGDDTLIGGAGNDVYLYTARDFDRDTIEGFSVAANTDKIDLRALNVADFTTLSRFIANDASGNAVITLGFYGNAESITLKGVSRAQLSAASFIFNTNSAGLTVEGTGYRDVLFGGNGTDTLTGYSGDDTLASGNGNDRLIGLSGNDTLIGGFGADRMEGGTGNDIYYVDNVGDQVIEAAESGTDTVLATLSYALAAGQHVETLATTSMAGAAAINLSGNEFAQRISGNAGRNYLNGGGGNDTLIGGAGIDTLNGGTGNDTLYVDNAGDIIVEVAGGGTDTALASVSYTLAAGRHIELLATTSIAGTVAINLTGNELAQRINGNNGVNVLNGGSGNDTLYGFNGNDTLNGGIGIDVLAGGYGNDRLYVDSSADRVVETYGQGTDSVFASVHYTLAAGQSVEIVATTSVAGTGTINLAGNELAQQVIGNNGVNRLYGNGGNDTLNGNGGNDVLFGGVGNDRLTGGAGSDYFVFNTALSSWSNVDRITDFNVAADTIQLDNAVMAALGGTGTLSAAKFWKSTAGVAHDADDRIIYDIDTGRLFYDADGSGSKYYGVHFATLAPNLALTNYDFQVI